jgi:hypothetical protein
MGAALSIRTDMEAAELRRLARREGDGRVRRVSWRWPTHSTG